MQKFVASLLFCGLILQGTLLHADEPEKIGLKLDANMASAYFFRGANVFQNEAQTDMNGLFAPSLSYTIPKTGLTLGYWAAYQTSGNNIDQLVDAGLGAEQDLFISYEYGLTPSLSLSGIMTAYLYPFATKQAAGVQAPTFFEPGFGLSWEGPVDLALNISYMHAMQYLLMQTGRYAYINPVISKDWQLYKTLSLDATLSGGYKFFTDDSVIDNRWDTALNLGGTFAPTRCSYVKMSVGLVWTNLQDKDFVHELAGLASLHLGFDF